MAGQQFRARSCSPAKRGAALSTMIYSAAALAAAPPTIGSCVRVSSCRRDRSPGPGPPGPNFPVDPPPATLPPGVWPIIGPELATYGVVQPIARQLGLTTLGTLHERIGDTLTWANAGGDSPGIARGDWARFYGQQIDNRYQAFADPRANGSPGWYSGRA